MAEKILEIQRLYKSYAQTEVLHDIHLGLQRGDFLVLVGPSGCGKSTLLNCIAGLETITSGSIHIDAADMHGVPPKDRDIAMVFQSYALYPNMSVAKNITFGMKVRGVSTVQRQQKLAEVAELLQIQPLLQRKPSQLSGGQRQRVAMGRALVRNPKLFLFDEPLSNLDAKLRISMRTEIKKLHRSLNASIVYVTHDQVEAMTLATHIAVLNAGVIQQIGTPAQIYAEPANAFVADFMGSPPMNLIPAQVRVAENEMQVCIQGEPQPLSLATPIRPPFQVGETRDCLLGLRPEHIALPRGDSGESARSGACVIDLIEPVGAETYAVTQLGGKQVTARMPADFDAELGAPLTCVFDLAQASYFDLESGARLG